MSTAIAKNLMAEMKLLGMLGTFEKALSDATRDQTSYSEFLDALLQAEADYRQERKTGYRVKAAKFTLRPAFEDIDFTASRSISKAQIKELYSLHWLNDARPVLLIGQTGVGKTFIAQATGLHACACGLAAPEPIFKCFAMNARFGSCVAKDGHFRKAVEDNSHALRR